MPSQPDSPDRSAAAARRRSRPTSRTATDATAQEAGRDATTPAPPAEAPEEEDISARLSFRDAQTALELSLAELQSPDLDVEQMAGLYRRASRYADRCEQLLQQVEQEVMQWDPGQPQDAPLPYEA